ncbi:MAG: rhamnogalacturonan lyase [Lentisphaeria bacterium]|nr:rhamnogalacturonan lyase [Lentisphaeria bacterium]
MNRILTAALAALALVCALPGAAPNYDFSRMLREKPGRGVVAVRRNAEEVFIAWRYLSRDAMGTGFNIYRDGKRINGNPVRNVTFYVDKNPGGGSYAVKPVDENGRELPESCVAHTLPADAPHGYVNIPLDRPADVTMPDGRSCSYAPNDASIGDVDGDGEYEIILKWDPSNSKDNSQNGHTGNVYLDCYKLDGRKFWRIDLGRNIRAGSHYTQFMVYDLDGDGIAEIVMKTADGTADGAGKVIGDAAADYRDKGGRVLDGPEFLTVFSGRTGEALQTIPYDPPRGSVGDWGDNYGNRCDRFLAAVAYLDGIRPSVVMCRGYYTRTVLAAYDWDGKKLRKRWVFDTNNPQWREYAGQGNHNLRVGDVDGDGCDEIIYGQMAVDHDGRGLYTTKTGHGDAIHLTRFSPELPGLQVWACHENRKDGATFRDAATGEILYQVRSKSDVGRCMAADIDPLNPGLEMWAGSGIGIRGIDGKPLANVKNISINMAVWWDGDLLRELLDGTRITKYNREKKWLNTIAKFDGCASNNSTKSTPCLQGDIIGDWREEVLLRTEDNTALRLYVSTIPTQYRFHTFLEDPVYRLGIAMQNVAYNQPAQPGFYFGPDLLKKTQVFRGTLLKTDQTRRDK